MFIVEIKQNYPHPLLNIGKNGENRQNRAYPFQADFLDVQVS